MSSRRIPLRDRLLLLSSAFLVLVAVGISSLHAEPTGVGDDPARTKTGIGALLKASPQFATRGLSADALNPFQPVATDSAGEEYFVVDIEFDSAEAAEQFAMEGVWPFFRFGKFVNAFMSPSDEVFEAIDAAPGIVWAEYSPLGFAPPPSRIDEMKDATRAAPPDPIVRGGVDGVTGKGTIVAIVDTGIDFRHADFIDYDENGQPTSRVKYFWDPSSDLYAMGVGQPAPYKYPNGAPIGTIFTQEDLTRELRGPNRIFSWDTHGHGTSCASIAAGDGDQSDGKYAGVAPDAEIIAVRVGSTSSGTMDFGFLFNAIAAWLDEVAGDQPLVVSNSWGNHMGGHDGQQVVERQFNAQFPLDTVGRVFLAAAGNEGSDPMHASGEVDPDDSVVFDGSGAGAFLALFFDTDDEGAVDLVLPGGASIERKFVHPLTGQLVIELSMTSASQFVLRVKNKSDQAFEVDAYVFGGAFSAATYEPEHLINSPGAADSMIAVGSYDWNEKFNLGGELVTLPTVFMEPMRVGAASAYTSPGPRRDGVMKPELTAPGQWHIAAAPLNTFTDKRESTGYYHAFNGTSAATPYTAGIIALAFEINPKLTIAQVKKLLMDSLSRDPHTGMTPNPVWGHGKLDYKAVQRLLAAVRNG